MDTRRRIYGRITAQAIVDESTIRHGPFAAISRERAEELLGTAYPMLLLDRVRNIGPTSDTIYPWNVVDYLCQFDPRQKNTKE